MSMAVELDDGEFWLPPQILTDDDLLADYKRTGGEGFVGNGDSGFCCYPNNGFGSFCQNSAMSSPVESVVSSTETESDEEDFIAGLTMKMANTTLNNDLWKVDTGLGDNNSKPWVMSGSPQSTLCSVLGGGAGGGYNQGSSRGSPNCSSEVSSPPAVNRSEVPWDLLYAAAGEVARMRKAEEEFKFYRNRGLLGPHRKPNPVGVPLQTHHSTPGFHSTQPQPISYHQLQVAQFRQLKQQQMMKQQSMNGWGPTKGCHGDFCQNQNPEMVQNRGRDVGGKAMGLSMAAWPPLQPSHNQNPPQNGSGMRAVFLGNPGTKSGCAGTGVFLPRRVGSSTETRKKPVCSTVLLPERVVQALNLNLEAMDGQPKLQSPHAGVYSPDYDSNALKYRNNSYASQQRRTFRPSAAVNPPELRLPQEWTY